MTEAEISYWIATTRLPGWSQSMACKEQLEAVAARQQRMVDEGRPCWAEDSLGFVVGDGRDFSNLGPSICGYQP